MNALKELWVTAYPATEAGIAACAEKLTQGGLVALPTETVYGLAGDATNADAIAAIYATKARAPIQPAYLPYCRYGNGARHWSV
jgi:tRNA A37 threonylcarbamoyladenosine synthetase subunit TsaC/SUA5/YrdC